MSLTRKARFEHDCDQCRFLGIHPSGDLYVHNADDDVLIVRYGNEGYQYGSTSASIVKRWIEDNDLCGGLPAESTGTVWEGPDSAAYLLAYARANV